MSDDKSEPPSDGIEIVKEDLLGRDHFLSSHSSHSDESDKDEKKHTNVLRRSPRRKLSTHEGDGKQKKESRLSTLNFPPRRSPGKRPSSDEDNSTAASQPTAAKRVRVTSSYVWKHMKKLTPNSAECTITVSKDKSGKEIKCGKIIKGSTTTYKYHLSHLHNICDPNETTEAAGVAGPSGEAPKAAAASARATTSTLVQQPLHAVGVRPGNNNLVEEKKLSLFINFLIFFQVDLKFFTRKLQRR